MRIAVKYAIDDVQVAIARVIKKASALACFYPREAIAQLAFIAEFPSHISKDVAMQVFTEASSIRFHPTAGDLKPLMAFPNFIALMMQYREAHSNKSTPNTATCLTMLGRDGRMKKLEAKVWLDRQFESFGFKPQT